jgi:hypothetical protein
MAGRRLEDQLVQIQIVQHRQANDQTSQRVKKTKKNRGCRGGSPWPPAFGWRFISLNQTSRAADSRLCTCAISRSKLSPVYLPPLRERDFVPFGALPGQAAGGHIPVRKAGGPPLHYCKMWLRSFFHTFYGGRDISM